MNLTSGAFAAGQPIPRKYTGDSKENVSPPLTWGAPPKGTQALALVVDDPDAPTPQPWVHWLIYNIPPDVRTLPKGVAPEATLRGPAGALQGKNSWGGVGYRGPEPPQGHGVHHYHFRLY